MLRQHFKLGGQLERCQDDLSGLVLAVKLLLILRGASDGSGFVVPAQNR